MAEIFNLSELCRCCHTDGSFRSLNLFYSYNGQVEEYADMLHETFGLILHQPSIEASYAICDTCIEKLRKALQFKKQVQECEIKFADYCNNEMALQTEIKIESELMEQDINDTSISPDTLQENESLKENENSSKKKQRGRPKKRKSGRPKTSEKSRAEQLRDATRRYKQAHPEAVRNAQKRYAEKHPEVRRAAAKRYAEKHPEVRRAAAKRYAEKHPEVRRAAAKRYAEKHPEVRRAAAKRYAEKHPEVNRAAAKRYRDKKRKVHKAAVKPSDKMIKPEVNIKVEECNDDTHDYGHSNTEYADKIELSDNGSDKEKKENIKHEQNCLEKHKSATPCTEILMECLKKEKSVETLSEIQILEKQKSNESKAKTKQKNRLEEEKFNIPGNSKSEPRIRDSSDTGAVNTCQNCNNAFKSEITLRYHLQRKHSIFSCKICKEMFGSKEALIKHEPIHSTVKHECDICGNVFTKKSGLKLHKNQHTRAKIFTCDICNKDFLYKNGLRKHIDFHLGRNKKIMCDLCGHTFNDMANLKSHIRAVHEKLRPFKCDQCPKTYSTRKILKIHTRVHTGERPYVCQHCDKAFVHSTALRYHSERLHTGPEFGCKTRSRLASGRHIGVKSYKCYYCERDFSGRFALNRHIERHKGTAKKFPCEICHKNFATKAVMLRHMKNIHDPNKQFVTKTKCNLCHITVTDMVKHMKTHTERLFQCEQCPKSYSETSALNRHVREIHCGITHDCNFCDKKYIKAKSLRTHKLKKHNAQVKLEQDARKIENNYI